MARTYVPQLRELVKDLTNYITRYQVKLNDTLDDPTFATLQDAQAALNALTLALGPEVLED